MGGLPKEEWYIVCFSRGKRRRMSVKKKKLVLMWERMLFMEKMCAKKRARKEVVCSK